MSENLNRSNQDFSKYDSMSIGELEEILRADAMGPERDNSDVDEILYIMEVLAKKRRQNGIAGKTALEAYQDFQQYYLPVVEEESKLKRRCIVIPFRRIAAVAASLVLVLSLSASANAFSFKDIWNAVARWAEETFSFSIGTEVSTPHKTDELVYTSLADALSIDGKDSQLVPTWFPDGYELLEIIVDRNPMQQSYLAIYVNGDSRLKVSVQSILSSETEQIEMSSQAEEVYSIYGIDFYIFDNHDQQQAVWVYDMYECYISGELTNEEIKLMIDSIRKG